MNRRKIAWWSLGALLVLAIVAYVVAWFTPIIGVGRVEVAGQMHADETAIVEATGIRVGDNFLRVDSAAAARGVAGVPWVNKVTVERALPNVVRVSVEEHRAVAYVPNGGNPLAVNDQGLVFLQGQQPEGVPAIEGVAAEDTESIAGVARALEALVPELRGQVQRVEVPDRESLTLVFPEERRVFWGSAERAAEKAEATRIVLTRGGQAWNVSNPALPTVRDEFQPQG